MDVDLGEFRMQGPRREHTGRVGDAALHCTFGHSSTLGRVILTGNTNTSRRIEGN